MSKLMDFFFLSKWVYLHTKHLKTVKAVFVSGIKFKLLTLFASSLSPVFLFSDCFTATTKLLHNIINIKLTSNRRLSDSAQRGPVYANYSCHYITMGAGSEQTVGAPICQWVGCRDDAGLVCFPLSLHGPENTCFS